MRDAVVTLQANARVNEKYFKLTFRSRELSRKVEPGQFLNMQIENALDPFLRRPFSYYRVSGDAIEVLYEILGKGTALLSSKKKGDSLRISGPLGRSFQQKIPKGKKRVLIAGGVGVPPLVFLAERHKTDYLLIGTKSKAEVMPRRELTRVKARIFYSTNDGSHGERGFVTVLLEKLIKELGPEKLFFQTCGPNVMMQSVMEIARRTGIEGEASIDKPMACGVGACLGCMVMTKDRGWQPSCTEGPVFSFRDLDYKII